MKRYLVHFFNFSISIGFMVIALGAMLRPDMLQHAWMVVGLLGTAALFLFVEMATLMNFQVN